MFNSTDLRVNNIVNQARIQESSGVLTIIFITEKQMSASLPLLWLESELSGPNKWSFVPKIGSF